jgi:hypothetical protein
MLDDSTMRDFVRKEGDIYYFNLRQDSPVLNLRPGDVIASTAGEGFLRRVEAISISGNLIEVKTSSATLEDAIKQGTITFTKELTYGDLQSSIALTPGVRLQRVATSSTNYNKLRFNINIICDKYGNCDQSRRGDHIKISGIIEINFRLDIAIDIGLIEGVKEFKCALITSPTIKGLTVKVKKVEAGFSGSIEIKKPVGKIPIAPTPIAVGPLVIQPEATVYVGIEGTVNYSSEITVTIKVENIIVGAHFKKGIAGV